MKQQHLIIPAFVTLLLTSFWLYHWPSSLPAIPDDLPPTPTPARLVDLSYPPVGGPPDLSALAMGLSGPTTQTGSGSPTPQELRTSLIPQLRWLVTHPILSYNESLAVESVRCGATRLQANMDQLEEDGGWWKTVTVDELEEARMVVAETVVMGFGLKLERRHDGYDTVETMESSFGTDKWRALFGHGRGIVYTAGNADTGQRLLTSVRILRRHGCVLPVEVWGFPKEIRAMRELRTEIEAVGNVVFKEIVNSETRKGVWKQFQIKGEAIARSSFAQVLYLDSDNIPTRDPTFLFTSPLFKETGIILWPDFTKDSASNPIFRTVGKLCNPHEWQVETGQILVDKNARSGMNLAALFVAEAMQRDSKFWFGMSGGDKDTFRYAFYFLSLPYTPAPHWLSAVGTKITTHKGHTFCGHTMLQYGLSADEWTGLELDDHYLTPSHAPPLFLHANLLKHSGKHNVPGSTFSSIKFAVPDLTRSALSRLLMTDVRGRVYNHRGMCTDIWDAVEGGAGEGLGKKVKEGAYDGGRVAVIDFRTSWGGLLRDFEEMYYEEGGLAGGW